MTAGEFATFKGKVFNGVSNTLDTPRVLSKDLPASIDWRDKVATMPGTCPYCHHPTSPHSPRYKHGTTDCVALRLIAEDTAFAL